MSLQDKLKERISENYKNKDKTSLLNKNQVLAIPDNIKYFKPRYDKINQISILSYTVKTDKDPKVKKGGDTYVLEFFIHRNIGIKEDSVLCLKETYGKACPICEEIEHLKGEYEKNKDLISALRPKKRTAYNVIDHLSDDTNDVKIFETFSNKKNGSFEKELLEVVVDPETGELICFPDPGENGYYVRFRATEESFDGKKFPNFKNIRFDKRNKAIPKEILDKTISLDELLNVPTYEQVKNMFLGIDSPTDTKESDDDEEYYEHLEKEEKKEQKKETTKEKNTCPNGHRFGKDIDAFDECIQCPVWEACSDSNKQ